MENTKGDASSVDLMLLTSAKKVAKDSTTEMVLSASIGNDAMNERVPAAKAKAAGAQARGMAGRKRTVRGDLVQHANRAEGHFVANKAGKTEHHSRISSFMANRKKPEIGQRRAAAVPSKIQALFSPSVRGGNRAGNQMKKNVLGDTTSQNARILDAIPEAEPARTVQGEDENKQLEDDKEEEGEKELPDIDSKDLNNALCCGRYMVNIYKWYKEYEQDLQLKPDFLDKQAQINAAMRHVVVDWMVETHFAMRLRPETLFLAVSYMDRFLAKVSIAKRSFHLLAGTCIYMAAKYEEMQAPQTRDIAESMESKYTSADILAMEKELFTALDGWFCAPTVLIFIRRYIRAAGYEKCEEAVAYCDYLAEIALYEYDIAHLPPSHIAAAITLIARRSFGDAPFYPEELRAHSECEYEVVLPIAKKLVSVLQKIPVEPKRKGSGRYVMKKYSSTKKHKVAHRAVPDIW